MYARAILMFCSKDSIVYFPNESTVCLSVCGKRDVLSRKRVSFRHFGQFWKGLEPSSASDVRWCFSLLSPQATLKPETGVGGVGAQGGYAE